MNTVTPAPTSRDILAARVAVLELIESGATSDDLIKAIDAAQALAFEVGRASITAKRHERHQLS